MTLSTEKGALQTTHRGAIISTWLESRFFCKLKYFRRLATRFDKLARWHETSSPHSPSPQPACGPAITSPRPSASCAEKKMQEHVRPQPLAKRVRPRGRRTPSLDRRGLALARPRLRRNHELCCEGLRIGNI